MEDGSASPFTRPERSSIKMTIKPRRQVLNGSNSRRTRIGSGHNINPHTTTSELPSWNESSTTGLHHRSRPFIKRHSSKSRDIINDDEDNTEEDDERQISFHSKVERSQSFKKVAAMIRSNIRQSINQTNQDANQTETIENTTDFADVAHQVVSTQRAAKGFLAMWSHTTTAVIHVYKGIHMEKKKLDLKTVISEFKENKRRQFYQELVVYLIFLAVFFSLLTWLPVQDSYQQNNVVGHLTCREEGVCALQQFDDVYAFASLVRDKVCDRQGVTAQWIRLGGVRFRQVRVQEKQCPMYQGSSSSCYPFYSPQVEAKQHLIGMENRTYQWYDGLGPLQPRFRSMLVEWMSSVESYGTGGYIVDLCDVNVVDLQQDEWLSVATRAFSIEFILMNPVTRVFTIGMHIFTIEPSGLMKHYPHTANLHAVGFERLDSNNKIETDDAIRNRFHQIYSSFDSRILCWIGLVLFFMTYCFGEATEMSTMGASTYLKSDVWNLFELTHLLVLASILTYSARFYLSFKEFASHLEEGIGKAVEQVDHTHVLYLLHSYQHVSDLAAIGSAVSLLKVFKFLRMNSTLNLLWRVLGMAMRDLMGFLVIFNLIFLGYSAMGCYAFGFALEEFSTITKSYSTCFHMLAGEMDYPRLKQANPRLAPIFIVTFIVLVFQILVNMFVAILSEYYESAKNDEGLNEDIEYDVWTRLKNYLKACSPTVVAHKNEVIRLLPNQTIRLISSNLVDQEETRQRAKKLFRGAVWRVVALLRFGMKFDRRIQLPDRKTTNVTATNSGKDKDHFVSHIHLSENFDHKTIKEMIPIGITIRLQGDSLLGDGIALKVIRHDKLSVECVVLGHTGMISSPEVQEDTEGREQVLELLGGEKLRIPWQFFMVHLMKIFFKELQMSLLRATKLWNSYSDTEATPPLIDDYHLLLLFESMRKEGCVSLRYDEVYRMLDLYLRKDKKKSHCTQAEVRQETLQVMFRFRKCLIDMPSREKEGHNYRPKPVDTSSVELGQLEYLADMLAHNCHDMWALERLKQGWQYGSVRNDEKKLHPNLVPWHALTLEEQQYDYRSSMETLKTILFMNYSVLRSSTSFHESKSISRSSSNVSDSDFVESSEGGGMNDSANDETGLGGKKAIPSLARDANTFRRTSLMEDSPYHTFYGEHKDLIYRPLPIDTSKITLAPRLIRLVDLLAENAHEVWAKGRMDEGWTYGPSRDDPNKKHPCLVPYIFLTDEEKEYDLNIAKETLKTLISMKFTLIDKSIRN